MVTSEKGFTVVELLISMVIVGIVVTGLYSLAISSSRFYLAQNNLISMQADGRSAMEFITRELRLAFGNPTVETTVVSNDTISFDHVDETGYSSGGNTSTVLNDTLKTWQANAFAPTATLTYTVRIVTGTGNAQTRTITANTATQLTVSPAWTTTPTTTSLYVITSPHRFTRTSTTDNILRYRVGATGTDDPLAANITSHSFSLPNTSTMDITVTAQTKSRDPATNQYRTYSMTETIRRRNN